MGDMSQKHNYKIPAGVVAGWPKGLKYVLFSMLLFMTILTQHCYSSQRYRIDWEKAQINGWENPLGVGATLTTDKAFDFDSPEYLRNHNRRHTGVDIVASVGSRVYSIGDGRVVKVTRTYNAMELVVIIKHMSATGDFFCIYGHIAPVAALKVNTQVKAGELLGYIKKAGSPSHLHFGINISSTLSEFLGACKGCGWGRVPRTVNPASVGWIDPILFLYHHKAKQSGTTISASTATILVMDVSGSMGQRWRGGVKIESAKKAALQFIEEVANEPRPQGYEHQIGVVTFSTSARLALPLTSDYSEAKNVIIQLHPTNSTNLGAGLVEALKELEKLPTAKRFVILLSDGMTNTGMSRSQILGGPVAEAYRKGICIHTVGFGDPGGIDEKFLREIVQQSGCGSYNYAASGLELFGTYVKIRHRMLGSNRIVEFTSKTPKGSRVYVLPGQSVALGAFQLTAPARELHYTLAWAENGRLIAELVDPSGRRVTASYPGAQIYSGDGFSHITVFSPKKGIWKAIARVITAFPEGVQYYGVVSARTGGFVIPYEAPEICIYDDVCIPLPNLPTWLLVGISLVALAVVVYQQLLGGR